MRCSHGRTKTLYFCHTRFLCMIILHALLVTRAPKGPTCLERLNMGRPNIPQNPDRSGHLHTACPLRAR